MEKTSPTPTIGQVVLIASSSETQKISSGYVINMTPTTAYNPDVLEEHHAEFTHDGDVSHCHQCETDALLVVNGFGCDQYECRLEVREAVNNTEHAYALRV